VKAKENLLVKMIMNTRIGMLILIYAVNQNTNRQTSSNMARLMRKKDGQLQYSVIPVLQPRLKMNFQRHLVRHAFKPADRFSSFGQGQSFSSGHEDIRRQSGGVWFGFEFV
jgi:hypothetical protein